ncbi:ABC-F family ATP-binding cassette domain-containing protein [Alkalibacterium putridalgicola]|uniref:ABC transporter ATP-binding protein n=1 Tax=Alkalibacterium putridalgicola TaxID=426703 RepID=A0A1H7V6X0_9LACT|nr:ABC-F family ATP-binding cassette domain-containing protein [Alkalibacterium putridalgicola]GEK89756.1 ABC transporter ATP-binding protein [Alkalibacterium putridalgicola]SEM04780.1 ATP-binding cassette, subfamily F, uup [Alkalibacterium putridalgicola]
MKEWKIEHLTHSYGIKKLFDDVSFSIQENQRIGLIGVNGTGKTTFLRIVAGVLKPDEGEKTHPGDYEISYLSQKNELDTDKSIFDVVFDGDSPMIRAARNYEEVLKKFSNDPTNPKFQQMFTEAEKRMNQEDAWNVNARAKAILNKLGLEDTDKRVSDLSGGQQKRAALAQVLVQEPDLLILDEPTNHLDFQMIEWLEGYLSSYRGSLLMVTHDRYFLDRVSNEIVELDNGKLEQYPGNYQQYIQLKAEKEATEQRIAHKQKQLYKQELAWMREGVRARGTKQEARKQRFSELEGQVKGHEEKAELELQLSGTRLGKKVLELEAAEKQLDDTVILDDFELLIQQTDRIGITGTNGSGKTTFLNILAGEEALDNGVLIMGETVKIGYYKQINEEFDEDKRVITYLREIAEEVKLSDGSSISVSQLLERFLFKRSMHGSPINKLSGGEKRRLYLLKILMQQPNVLLLDEPTNDLDVQTLTILEEFIGQFSGAVIAVSHDRYFLDKIASKLLIFKGEGKIEESYASLTEYLEQNDLTKKEKQSKLQSNTVSSGNDRREKKEKTSLTYMEKKEWETIESEIEALESELEDVQSEIELVVTDHVKLNELTEKQTELSHQLEEKYSRWEYLAQYV